MNNLPDANNYDSSILEVNKDNRMYKTFDIEFTCSPIKIFLDDPFQNKLGELHIGFLLKLKLMIYAQRMRHSLCQQILNEYRYPVLCGKYYIRRAYGFNFNLVGALMLLRNRNSIIYNACVFKKILQPNSNTTANIKI